MSTIDNIGWTEFLRARGLLTGNEITCPDDSVLEMHFRDGSNHSVFPQSHDKKPIVENGIIEFEHSGKERLYYALTEITSIKRRVNPRFATMQRREYAMEEDSEQASAEAERRRRTYEVIEPPKAAVQTIAPPQFHTARGYEDQTEEERQS